MIEALWHWFRHKRVKKVPVTPITPPPVDVSKYVNRLGTITKACDFRFEPDDVNPDGYWCNTCQRRIAFGGTEQCPIRLHNHAVGQRHKGDA